MSTTTHDDLRNGSGHPGEPELGTDPIYYSHDRTSYGRPVDELTEEERAARAGDWIYADASEWTDTDLPGRHVACALQGVCVLHRAADDDTY